MSLQPGDRLGGYEILSPLGAGGMGVVYRARDQRLGREVAIKTLPEGFAADPERLARFEREARVLAALNHANVATVYGFESDADVHFLAMELVPGDTLEDRIARGPIAPEQALPLFIEIARGLEAAHAKGVVHRDLKPANIKVGSTSGSGSGGARVKILDFGLAKALAPDEDRPSPNVSASPTLTLAATMRGEILGTAAYMSPEQAQGEPADHRADIWAFGVCLLEALTGRRVFDGANHSFVLASVLKDEPDLDRLPAGTPSQVRRLLRRCLEKDRDRRLHDIADARLELEEALAAPAEESAVTAGGRASRLRIAVATVLGLAAGVAGALLAVRLATPAPQPAPLNRFVLSAPPGEPPGRTPGTQVAISPDGRSVAYVTGQFPSTRLVIRHLDQLESTPVQAAPGAYTPFFSPDGEWIGYVEDARTTLRKVSVRGGPGATLCKADAFVMGASWGADDTVVFGLQEGGLQRVSAAGGEPVDLTELAEGEVSHSYPELLPGGRAVLFTAYYPSQDDRLVIFAQSLDTGERKLVVEGGSTPRYVASGHVMYAIGSTVYALPYDAERLEAKGDAVPVLESVAISGVAASKYAVSADGTLVYAVGSGGPPRSALVWVDREGNEEPLEAPPRFYVYPRISPDGTKVALDVRAEEEDIWIWDLERSTLSRLTFSPGTDAGPVWSADGRTVYYGSAQKDGGWDIFGSLADGTGAPLRLTEQPGVQAPASSTPDGAGLVAVSGRTSSGPFDILLVDTGGAAEPETLLAADFDLGNARLSPDGRWLAYQSNESGAEEVFVRPFPALESGRWQVSAGGGTRPSWSRDGAELFYLDATERLTAVTVAARGDGLAFGRPQRLLERVYLNLRTGPTYDVSPDGRRFLMVKDLEEDQEKRRERQVIAVQNWLDELRRVAPPRR